MMSSQFHFLSIIWTTSHLEEHLEKPLKNKLKCSFRFRPCKNINISSFITKLLRQGTLLKQCFTKQ